MTDTPTADWTPGEGKLPGALVPDACASEEHTPIHATHLVCSHLACPAVVLEWTSCWLQNFS